MEPTQVFVQKSTEIVIIGAGCFGVSTAYHLLSRGYKNVTVLDRSATLPAPDAASNDLNRIVRSSYADLFYAKLGREAISSWRDQGKWGDSYHESGVIIIGLSNNDTGATGNSYTFESYKNDVALGSRFKELNDGKSIRACFPAHVPTASFQKCAGYLNLDGGWVNAGKALTILLKEVAALDGKVLPGKKVSRFCKYEQAPTDGRNQGMDRIIGIECSDGTVLKAELVIIATGSWTPSNFPELGLGRISLATGQPVVMMQLSQEEADKYRECPVILDFNSGFYIFPPNENNVVKIAKHSAGYTYISLSENDLIPTPRTITSDEETGLCIPKTELHEFRRYLRVVYPDLAEKPFSSTRLCWYNDTPDEDWIIGRHPENPSIILATGGSGHAFKFLPVIGRLVADIVENKLEQNLVARFAIDRQPEVKPVDHSRSGRAVKLDLDSLNTAEDLLPEAWNK